MLVVAKNARQRVLPRDKCSQVCWQIFATQQRSVVHDGDMSFVYIW